MKIVRYAGSDISPYLQEVARLRIGVFREFPYLYEGELTYEEKYLAAYAKSPQSLFVLAIDETGAVVGASTGIPMHDADTEFRKPFERAGWDIAQIFYFGESVLDASHRGKGIGVAFFEHRERYARELGLRWCTFCAVDRCADDPRRPPDYAPLDGFWQRRGYAAQPALQTSFRWREVGQNEDTLHAMTFWTRDLEAE